MTPNRSIGPVKSVSRRSLRTIALASSGWVALAATALPSGSIPRVATTVVFVLACPGAALVRHWPERDGLERLVLAVAVSTAVAMLVAEGLILVGNWSPVLTVVLLATITTAASLVPARVELLPPGGHQ